MHNIEDYEPSVEDQFEVCWEDIVGHFDDDRLYEIGLVAAETMTDFPYVAVEAALHYRPLLLDPANASLTAEEVVERHEETLVEFLSNGGGHCWEEGRPELPTRTLAEFFELRLWREPEQDREDMDGPGFILDFDPIDPSAMEHRPGCCPVSDVLSAVLGILEVEFDIADPKHGALAKPSIYGTAWPSLDDSPEMTGPSCLPRIPDALRAHGFTVHVMPLGALRPTDWREENRRQL